MQSLLFDLFVIVVTSIWIGILLPRLQRSGRYRGLIYFVSVLTYVGYLLALGLMVLIAGWLFWVPDKQDAVSIGFAVFLIVILVVNLWLVLPKRTRHFKLATQAYFHRT